MEELSRYVDKVLVISSEKCPSCIILKKRVSESEIKDKVVFIDVEKSELAKEIAEALEITSVPTTVEVRKENDKILLCTLDGKCVEANYE